MSAVTADPEFEKSSSAKDAQVLKEAMDGTLKNKVNEVVLALGRGRLRGDTPEGDVVIGSLRATCFVNDNLDGRKTLPDISRFLQ